MDEQVKARLIGATVLVVIAVALVPELLSGPKRDAADTGRADGKRSVVIDLGGATSNAARLQPAAPAPTTPRAVPRLPTVEAPGEAAAQAESAPPAGASATKPDAAPAAVEPAATVAASEPIPPPATTRPAPQPTPVPAKPATAEAKSATPAATSGGWAVQVGAFGSAETARKLVSDLKKDGLPAYVAPLSRNGKTLHRVRVGPEPTRAEADKLAAKLKGRGLPASVVSGA